MGRPLTHYIGASVPAAAARPAADALKPGRPRQAEFLAARAQRTGCRRLVNVNNIYVNARNAGTARGASDDAAEPVRSCRDWLDRLPTDLLGKIHLAGHCAMEDIVIDDHGSRFAGDVWRLYRHAIRRFGAVPSLVEWDTAIPPLAVSLEEVRLARAMAVEQREETV